MLKRGIILLIILIILPSAFAFNIWISEAKCYNDGSVQISVATDSKDIRIDTKDIKLNLSGVSPKGKWNKDFIKKSLEGYGGFNDATFKSVGGILNANKYYNVSAFYFDSVSNSTLQDTEKVYCPGLQFTCDLLWLKINNCTNSEKDGFAAELLIKGLDQPAIYSIKDEDLLTFKLEADYPYRDINEFIKNIGGLPQNYRFKRQLEDNYLLTSKVEGVKFGKLTVSFNKDNIFIGKCADIFQREFRCVDKVEGGEIFVDTEENNDKKESLLVSGNWKYIVIIISAIFVFFVVVTIISNVATHKKTKVKSKIRENGLKKKRPPEEGGEFLED